MESVNIAAKQLRWRFSGDDHDERGTLIDAASKALKVRRWNDSVVLEMIWGAIDWVRPADHELWGLEIDARQKSYLTKRGATYENCNLGVCDIILPEGTEVKPNHDADEYRDHIATLPSGEQVMFYLDTTGFAGWITGIINIKGALIMGHYPHTDAPCPHY